MEKAANEGMKLPISNADRGECAQMYQKSAQMYRSYEQFDKAASMLMKASIAIQDIDLNASVIYIGEACTVLEEEGRGLFSRDTFINGVAFLLKHNRYEDAINLLNRHNKICEALMTTFENDLYKNLLSILVIRVHVGEYETAVQEYKEFVNKQEFSSSTEHECAYNLMTSLIHGSNEELAKCTSQQTFTFLNNQIARLARRLTQFDNTKLPNFLAKGLKLNEVLEIDEEDTNERKTYPTNTKGELDFQGESESHPQPPGTRHGPSLVESPPNVQAQPVAQPVAQQAAQPAAQPVAQPRDELDFT